ncbi:unnamed protein product [Mytilus coruscus]|uniref:Neurotransmitter-gated ion-channel transmembrane domain-containing protein n=1 Tax=Mytilus coruscus TaxID=42192 RepID=A0A6J8BLY9_MYTCO|nr:unnamed protein product [Mytilus coruscus]
MFSEHYTPGERLTPLAVERVYTKEVLHICKKNTYMGIWQIFALRTVLKRKICSIYPKLGPDICQMTLNRMVEPVGLITSDLCGIIWTTLRTDLTGGNWLPNHFVPLLPLACPTFKNIDDDENNANLETDDTIVDLETVDTIVDLETDDTIVDLETDDTIVDLETVDTIVDLETDDTIVDLETVNTIVDLETDDTIVDLETVDTIVDLETVDTIVDLETDDTIVDLETVNTIVDLETDDTIVDLETVDTIVDLETDDTIVDLETDDSIVDLETVDTIVDLETDDTIVDLETVDTIVDLETDDTIVDLETVNSIFTDKSSAVPLTVNNKVQAHHPKLDDINADTILTNNNPLESVGTNLTKTPEPVPLTMNNKVRFHHPKLDDINADTILTNNNPLESVGTNLTKTPEPVPLTVNNKDLTISLTTERSDEEIDLIEDRSSLSGVNTGTFMDAQEWDIYTHVETYEGKTTLEYASDETHPIFYAQCRVKRKVGYFLWNIVFIVSLITVLTFTTFSIEPSSADRLGVTITLLLTSVTFKLIVKQSLPTISYLTYLDLYVIAALVFLGLTSAQHAIIRYMFNYYTEAQIIKYDNYSIITLLAIFCAFHVIFGVYMRLTAIKRRTIMMEKDKIYMSKRKFIDHFGENARTERVIEMSMSKTRGGTRI